MYIDYYGNRENDYDVEILINGKKIPQYEKNGMTYVEGREGSTYSIKVRNNTYNRVKAVITVDGFSILDDNNNYETGYIINGRDSLHVKGFRTSENTEAVFTFSRKGESRSQKVFGYAKNAGVIGVRIYTETKLNPHYYGYTIPYPQPVDVWNKKLYDYTIGDPLYDNYTTYCDTSSGADVSSSTVNYNSSIQNGVLRSCQSVPDFKLGTEMGEDVQSHIRYVEFNTGSLAFEKQIHYTTRDELEKIGISFKKTKAVHIPQAFGGFCKRPK